MGNAILLQFYEQNENPRQLGGGPGSSEVIFAYVHFNKEKPDSQYQLYLTGYY